MEGIEELLRKTIPEEYQDEPIIVGRCPSCGRYTFLYHSGYLEFGNTCEKIYSCYSCKDNFTLDEVVGNVLRESRHDEIIEELIERLENSRDYIFLVKQDYDLKRRRGLEHHEVDLIAFYKHYALVFEVKSRDSHKARKKARKQLFFDEEYIRRVFPEVSRIWLFYAFPGKVRLISGYER